MNNKTLALILFVVLLLSGYVPIAVAHNAPFPTGYDPNSVVVDTIGEPETLDPAWCYDIGSAEVIFNVYETMVFWDYVPTAGPYAAGRTDQFKPLLATEWTWQNGPAPYVKTIYFKIRTGVTFHDGNPLTPADVEYSWERWLVQDRAGGPQWMLYYPLMGLYAAETPTSDPNFGDKINNAIESNATHAWIHLMNNFPETTFIQIMTQSWASVVEKAWAVAKGDFDGNWAHGWQYIWNAWHNPALSHIADAMMGTGPYKFDFWVEGTAYSVIKNDAYWDGWPARVERQPSASNERIGGFISRITWRLRTSWTDRRATFLAGDTDFTSVPRQYRDQILGQMVGGEPIRCLYPVEPNIAVDALFFNFNIDPTGYLLGPGFNPASPHTIAEDRIPVDLFSDIHMRRGFAAAFDYNTFLDTGYLGEAVQPADPIIPGLSYDNPANTKPMFNLTKASEELQAAWGGAIWANGMTFSVIYNSGNVARVVTMTILMNSINSLNPKFHMNIREIGWGYLPTIRQMPLFAIGWLVDYPDPDDFAFPFMHSQGTFAVLQIYNNPRADALIQAGAVMPYDTVAYNGELDAPDPRTLMNNYNAAEIAADPMSHIPPDTRWPRRSIYYELQAIYVEDAPGFCLDQPVGRGYQQAWMRGWYYNPVYPGLYAYHRWKAKTHFGDANNDGIVNVVDAATISASWTKPTPTSSLGPLGYKTQADLTGGTGGTVGGGGGLVAGIPDGKGNVVDSALVSAYWDGPPQGPQHP